jgi:hypothetical protein
MYTGGAERPFLHDRHLGIFVAGTYAKIQNIDRLGNGSRALRGMLFF